MRITIIHIILILFQFSSALSQTKGWKLIHDSNSGVSVRMPEAPTFNKEQLRTIEGDITKEVYTILDNEIEYVFESQTLFETSKRANAKAILNTLKLTAIQNRGTEGNKQNEKKDGFSYNYTEIPLVSGDLIRSITFVFGKQLIQIYVKGSIVDVYGINANYYLESWNIPKVAEAIEAKKDKPEKKRKEKEEAIRKTDFDWEVVKVADKIYIEFPGNPFKKETFVTRGRSGFLVSTYSYTSINDRLIYVATKRNYNNDEGQLSDEALYDFMISRMIENKKIKKPKEIESNSGKQYVSFKFFKYSRLKLIRIDNAMYQFLVIGKKKNIYSDEVEYFFNQTNSLH